MSGHSKWDKIHRQKGAADQKRGRIFTVLVKNIILAAKSGSDPELNFKLRLALDKAKAANMPKDNIERAIAKGSGSGEGVNIEEVVYEGYGPSGVAILIEAATDNKNRTSGELKFILSKGGGSLAGPNAVKWMFDHKGIIRIPDSQYTDLEEFQLELIDLGADDVQEESGGVTVYSKFSNFPQIKKALEEKNITLDYADVEWIAKDEVQIDESVKKTLEVIGEQLDDNDDVSSYFTSAAA